VQTVVVVERRLQLSVDEEADDEKEAVPSDAHQS
jgi:hypothetical protein